MTAESPLPPLFLLGCPRSGTTMLAGLLEHTPWGAPFETHFITRYHDRLSQYGDLAVHANRTRLLRDILGERPVMQLELDIDPDAFTADPETASLAVMADRLCRQAVASTGQASWGDKTPEYILHLETISTLFPDSRVIFIMRDGRDVGLSLMERSWGPNNLPTSADYWARCNEWRPIHERMKNDGMLFPVHYEDLLREPRATLERLLDWLALEEGRDAILAQADQIRRGNHDKWRTRMSARNIERFERIAGDTLERLGYERTHPQTGLNALEKAYFALHDRAHLAWHLFYSNVIEGIAIRFFGKKPFAD